MCFSNSFWRSSSLDVPAGVTQEEGHTGFLIHLPSAVRALFFLARRIQPFPFFVDREVEFCVLNDLIVLHSLSIFILVFRFFEKNPVCRDRTYVPTCQKVTRLPLSCRGDRLCEKRKGHNNESSVVRSRAGIHSINININITPELTPTLRVGKYELD